jgi:hypothetical protein
VDVVLATAPTSFIVLRVRVQDTDGIGSRATEFRMPALPARLGENHGRSPGAWLAIAKKGASRPTVSYPEAIEAALCFGWIDGQKERGDDGHWLQSFTPRASRSRWSRINRDKGRAAHRRGTARV